MSGKDEPRPIVIIEGYQPKRNSKDRQGAPASGGETLDLKKLKPPKGGSAIQPPPTNNNR